MTGRRWVGLVAALALLAGCTTVPSSSAPQVVRTLNRGSSASPQATITPEPNDGPQDVVEKFVSGGAQADAGHSTSRQFLTPTAARKWQDTTTVVVDDTELVTTIDGNRATVAATGHPLGQLDAAGVFTPTLKYLGSGAGAPETFSFRLIQVNGQWRIDQLPQGVLIGLSAFNDAFGSGSELYFLDSAGPDSNRIALVPDLRYTSLNGQALASWLLTQLLAGPRPELTQSVLSELPEQVGKPTVQLGDPIVLELPGTAQLDSQGKNAIAAQLAYTFAPFEYDGAQLMITDSGRPVRIPEAAGTTFTQDNFSLLSPALPTTSASAKLYFIRNRAVIDGSTDLPLPGALGQSARDLDSIALRSNPAGGLEAAGVSEDSLLVGTDRGMSRVALPSGGLSRPEWRPHAEDVWVGAGGNGAIYRVQPGQAAKAVSITSPVGGGPSGQVIAVRFSSDGVRLAAVVRSPDGSSAVWVGSVVTSAGDVRIASFEPITTAELVVTDVAWTDPTRLAVIASSQSKNLSPRVWAISSDGSRLTEFSKDSLPEGSLTAIAGRDGQPAVVSDSGFIWAHASEDAPSWTGYPAPKATTQGVNPVFGQ